MRAICPSNGLFFVAFVLFGVFGLAQPAQADVKLPSIFGDNMVLQKDHTLYFWGLSDPKEFVTIYIQDKRFGTTADEKGAWWVKVPQQDIRGPFSVTVKGKNIITINNVILGDVWLCSGQSNMYAQLADVDHTQEDIDQANIPGIRLFKEEPNCSGDPEFDGGGHWVLCNPETVLKFSAIAYFFGKEVNHRTHVPLGLIQAGRAASTLQTWLPKEGLEKTQYKGLIDEHVQVFEHLKQLNEELSQARASGDWQKLRSGEKKIQEFKKQVNTATCAYNALIAPLTPFTLKGVLWYQGENDVGENAKFRNLFVQMIQSWREEFRQAKLPFYYVQMPPIGSKKKEPEDSYYAELREAQASIQKVPYCFMAHSIDTGTGDNLPMHPRDKKMVAHRLAYLVLATQYREPLKCFAPSFDTFEISENKVKVHFLRAEPELVTKNGPARGFEIAGDDRVFYNAKARIEGDNVIVSSEKVKKPIAVRYCWADNPEGNLFNTDGFPVVPFRTDAWLHRKTQASGAGAGQNAHAANPSSEQRAGGEPDKSVAQQ
jgi:sialate O-acetylesterase